MPLSAQQHHTKEPPSAEVLQARAEKSARDAGLSPKDVLSLDVWRILFRVYFLKLACSTEVRDLVLMLHILTVI